MTSGLGKMNRRKGAQEEANESEIQSFIHSGIP